MKKYLSICFLSIFLLIILGLKINKGAESDKSNRNDWPKFRGRNGAGISTETGLLKSWPEAGRKEIWRIPIGVGYSSVASSNGRIYTMDSQEENEYLVCLDETNGNEIWRYKIGSIYLDSTGNGPRSTPTIDEELVFALSATGHLAAVNKKDGTEIWSVDINNKFGFRKPENWWGFSTSPLIENNLLILEVGGIENKSIAALNKRSGKVEWTTHTDFAAYSTPIPVDFNNKQQFVFVTANHVVSISPEGKIYWKHPWQINIIKIAMPVFIPPDMIFVSASYDIGAVLLKMKNNNDKIGVEEVWNSKVMRNHFHSSVFVDKHLYGFDNATLKCIVPETGEQKWAKRRLGKGSLIYADGHFIVLSERGKLVLIEANPDAYIEKSSVQVFKGKTWTPPTLAKGKLFLRNQNQIICLNLKSTE